MNSPAADVVRLLTVRGETLAVAESLTGGLVAAEITAAPGASKAFRGSVTAYATELKAELLGVDEGLLAVHGPVHPVVARQMAEGVLTTFASYGTLPATKQAELLRASTRGEAPQELTANERQRLKQLLAGLSDPN